MKRKFVKLGALFGASAVGLALLGTAETLQGFLAPVLGSSSMPFFHFAHPRTAFIPVRVLAREARWR